MVGPKRNAYSILYDEQELSIEQEKPYGENSEDCCKVQHFMYEVFLSIMGEKKSLSTYLLTN
jgi:hypothetical protein